MEEFRASPQQRKSFLGLAKFETTWGGLGCKPFGSTLRIVGSELGNDGDLDCTVASSIWLGVRVSEMEQPSSECKNPSSSVRGRNCLSRSQHVPHLMESAQSGAGLRTGSTHAFAKRASENHRNLHKV